MFRLLSEFSVRNILIIVVVIFLFPQPVSAIGLCDCTLSVDRPADTSPAREYESCTFEETIQISSTDQAELVDEIFNTQYRTCTDNIYFGETYSAVDADSSFWERNGLNHGETELTESLCEAVWLNLDLRGEEIQLLSCDWTEVALPSPVLTPPPDVVEITSDQEDPYVATDFTRPDMSGLNPLPNGTTIPILLGKILRTVTGLFGSIALLMIIYGGVTIMVSASKGDQVKKGANIVLWASLGLIAMMASYALVQFVFSAIS